ncbi:hypothetical protein GGR57DRAFT_116213 [Xylariaceae sp. FL1272]|nr:hypothetical protein GGR57DRAFT_116213 [Xylariaceae sp. FL1272]
MKDAVFPVILVGSVGATRFMQHQVFWMTRRDETISPLSCHSELVHPSRQVRSVAKLFLACNSHLRSLQRFRWNNNTRGGKSQYVAVIIGLDAIVWVGSPPWILKRSALASRIAGSFLEITLSGVLNFAGMWWPSDLFPGWASKGITVSRCTACLRLRSTLATQVW